MINIKRIAKDKSIYLDVLNNGDFFEVYNFDVYNSTHDLYIKLYTSINHRQRIRCYNIQNGEECTLLSTLIVLKVNLTKIEYEI